MNVSGATTAAIAPPVISHSSQRRVVPAARGVGDRQERDQRGGDHQRRDHVDAVNPLAGELRPERQREDHARNQHRLDHRQASEAERHRLKHEADPRARDSRRARAAGAPSATATRHSTRRRARPFPPSAGARCPVQTRARRGGRGRCPRCVTLFGPMVGGPSDRAQPRLAAPIPTPPVSATAGAIFVRPPIPPLPEPCPAPPTPPLPALGRPSPSW